MRLILIVFMQFAWSFGVPQANNGAGSFAYIDSSGRKSTGTYKLRNGQVIPTSGDIPVPFSESAFPGYGYGFDYGLQAANFFPTYFSNLENILQEAFESNIENQNIAYNAAKKAFDLSSNQAGYSPYFATRLNQPSFNYFGGPAPGGYPSFPNIPRFDMQNYPNSAYASAVVGPGFRSQIAQINPANPNTPNVNVYRTTASNPDGRNYYSVSSNSYSNSMNVNGKEVSSRGSTSIIDDNGRITQYSVRS